MKIIAVVGLLASVAVAHDISMPQCSGKTDGYYSLEKCGRDYVACTAGDGIMLSCGADQVFDEAEERCDFEENVADCSSAEAKSAPIEQSIRDEPQSEQPMMCESSGDVEDSSADAQTEWGVCSSKWFHCAAAGVAAVERSCPAGLYYDMENDQCLNKEDIYACSGKQLEAQPKDAPILPSESSQQQEQTQPQEPAQQQAQEPAQQQAQEPAQQESCKSEGIQEISSCSQKWHHCSGVGAAPIELSCPGELYYDVDKEQCLDKADVKSCQEGGESQDNALLPPSGGARVSSNDGLDLNEFCAEKDDGTYVWEATCAPTFSICKDGLGYLISCPDLNLFQPSTKQCVPEQLCQA